MSLYSELAKDCVRRMNTAMHFNENTGSWTGYAGNPSRSQSSPWARSDMWTPWHPFDALLAERRAALAAERVAVAVAAHKDAAWWDERRLG